MTIHQFAGHVLRPTILAAGVAALGMTALPAQAAPAPVPWHALFPPARTYPHGTHLLPVQTATRADTLVDPTTADQVTRLGFVAGGVQVSNLPRHAVASVTVLVFRADRDATTFLRQDQPSALANPATPGTEAGGLGAGARYVSGGCAGCGTGAPPLGILLMRRGTAVVQILTQPPDHALALRLGHAALRR